MVIDNIDSYSDFSDAATRVLDEKLMEKMSEIGFIQEMEKLRDIKEKFQEINDSFEV